MYLPDIRLLESDLVLPCSNQKKMAASRVIELSENFNIFSREPRIIPRAPLTLHTGQFSKIILILLLDCVDPLDNRDARPGFNEHQS